MSHYGGTTRLGAQAFNHDSSVDTEEEYDQLRNHARQEFDKMKSCYDRAHEAYESNNGAEAHDLSEEGKKHKANGERYNKQASEYIFRENNAVDRVPADTIDLHGQFVEEAEGVLEQRIKTAKAQNQTHLHVIVGKGNHSPDHIQKIKPAVEKLCREEGLQFKTEQNEGRIYINLTGGSAAHPPKMPHSQTPQYTSPQYSSQTPQYTSPQHSSQTPQYSQPLQQHSEQHQFQSTEIKKNDDSVASCLKGCCTMM